MPNIGDVRVNFIADMAAFNRNTAKGEDTLRKFAGTAGKTMATVAAGLGKAAASVVNLRNVFVGAAAAFAASKFVGSLHQAALEVDKIGKAAHRLGMSVPQMSALRFAAGQAGVSFEALAAMSSKALINVSKFAAAGDTTLRLGKMTVALTDASGRVRSITDLLPDIADGIKSAGSAAEQLRLSQTIFGKGGADQFITFLQESGDLLGGLRSQTEKASRLGVIFSEGQFRKLRDYGDAVDRLQQAWFGVKVQIMTEVAPTLQKLVDGLALRLAEMPRVLRASVEAVRAFAFGSAAERDQAAAAIGRFKDSLLALFKGAAIEMGRVLAVALVEATTIGFQLVGPTLSDVFRDALGPILSEIPGIEIKKSLRGQLADMQAELNRARDAERSVLRGRRSEMSGIMGRSQRSPLFSIAASQAIRDIDALASKRQDLEEKVAKLAAQVAAEPGLRMESLAAAFRSGLTVTAQVAEESSGKLKALAEEADKAKEALLALYGKAQPGEAEAAGPTEGAKAIAEAIGLWNRLTKSISAGPPREATTWGGFWDSVRGKVEELTKASMRLEEQQDKMRDSALAFAEEADPSIALARRIADVRKLAAEFPEILGEDKVSLLVQRWTADFERLHEKTRSLSEEMGDAIKGFASSAGDAFARFAIRAEGSMKELLLAWTQTLVSMAATKLMFEPFFDAIGKAVGGAATPGAASTRTGMGPPAEAKGGAWQSGQRFAFASGGIVDRPTLFPHRRGVGLMGEAGPEAIMPLKRIGGYLGVRAVGGGVTVNVIDQRSGGEPVQTREEKGPDGRRLVQVLVRDAVRGMASDGSLDQVLRGYGAKRRGTPR